MNVIWRWDVEDEWYFSEPQTIEAPDWYSKEDVAESVAEKYHSENDGWEDDWPVKFRIYAPNSEEFTVINVDREYEPTFSAYYTRDQK